LARFTRRGEGDRPSARRPTLTGHEETAPKPGGIGTGMAQSLCLLGNVPTHPFLNPAGHRPPHPPPSPPLSLSPRPRLSHPAMAAPRTAPDRPGHGHLHTHPLDLGRPPRTDGAEPWRPALHRPLCRLPPPPAHGQAPLRHRPAPPRDVPGPGRRGRPMGQGRPGVGRGGLPRLSPLRHPGPRLSPNPVR
jgi:hypothetical protein